MIKSIALFFRNGSSDKEYHVSIEPKEDLYVVNFAYGRRGSALKPGTKTATPVSLEEATKIYDKIVKKQISEGYVANGEGTPFSGVEHAGESTGLVPQLLNPISVDELPNYLSSPDWMVQEKLDGKKVMVRISDGVVTASNRNGLVCGIPLETAEELACIGNVVLDGELIGSMYGITDILEMGGKDLREFPAITRYHSVEDLINTCNICCPMKLVFLVSNSNLPNEERQDLVESLQNKEGVVLKLKTSKYEPGRPNSGGNQLKCKFWSSCSAAVVALNSGKRSVAISLYSQSLMAEERALVGVGNVTIPANYEIPKVGDVVEIKYLYAYPEGSLYQPQYLGKRDDVPPDLMSSLKFKSNYDE